MGQILEGQINPTPPGIFTNIAQNIGNLHRNPQRDRRFGTIFTGQKAHNGRGHQTDGTGNAVAIQLQISPGWVAIAIKIHPLATYHIPKGLDRHAVSLDRLHKGNISGCGCLALRKCRLKLRFPGIQGFLGG